MWFVYTMEYYSPTKRGGLVISCNRDKTGSHYVKVYQLSDLSQWMLKK